MYKHEILSQNLCSGIDSFNFVYHNTTGAKHSVYRSYVISAIGQINRLLHFDWCEQYTTRQQLLL